MNKAFFYRIFWFGVGGALCYGVNTGLFIYFNRHLLLSREVAYAISLSAMTGFTFGWSYFVNFRTSASWHSCAKRYLACLAVCYVLNYVLVQAGFRFYPTKPKLIILIVQACIAGFKFFIYHFWVFPDNKV